MSKKGIFTDLREYVEMVVSRLRSPDVRHSSRIELSLNALGRNHMREYRYLFSATFHSPRSRPLVYESPQPPSDTLLRPEEEFESIRYSAYQLQRVFLEVYDQLPFQFDPEHRQILFTLPQETSTHS